MRRLPIVGVALLLAGITSTAQGEEAPVSTFEAFEGRTDSYAAGLSTKQISAAPVPIEMFLTRSRTEVNSQPHAIAYAGIVDVPLGELASMFGFPGQLPNYCYSQYPGEPDNQCGGGTGRTHADGDGFNLDATSAESTVAAAAHSDDQLKIGASRSHSASRIVDGVLQTTTEIVLQQVDIGGAIGFEQLRSSARAATNGLPGGAKAEAALTVSGVTIMGQRVPVPDQLDLATLTKDVLGPLSDQLATRGIRVRAVAPPTTTAGADGREAVGSVAGLFVESVEPATGNRVAISLGVARASVVGLRPADSGAEPVPDGPSSPLPLPAPAVSDAPASSQSQTDSSGPGGASPSSPAFTTAPAPSSGGQAALPVSAGRSSAALPSATSSGTSAAGPLTPGSPVTVDSSAAAAPSGRKSSGSSTAAAGPRAASPSLALTSEVVGERVADRLPALYGLGAAGILILGLFGFGLARGVRS